MAESKYNALKNAITELGGIYEDEKGMQAIMELLPVIDQLEGNESANETDLMDKNEWFGLSYMDKIELKQSKPEQFKNSMAGKFKGGE